MSEGRELPHILLSGPLSVGKTTLAYRLAGAQHHRVLSMREALRNIAGRPLGSRAALQAFGAGLEAETAGQWITDVLLDELRLEAKKLVVDALRTVGQATAARQTLDPDVVHVHLIASSDDLAQRFSGRSEPDIVEAPGLVSALANEIERSDESLLRTADIVIDTTGREAAAVHRAAWELLLHR